MKEIHNLPVQFNERIHAFSIDYGIVFLSMLIVIFLYMDPVFKLLIVLTVWYMMNIFPSFIKSGTSLGKKNSKIIVVNELNKEVTLKVMHFREIFILVIAVITVGFYFPIAFLLLNRRSDKRSIHDLIFKTKVIYKDSHISG